MVEYHREKDKKRRFENFSKRRYSDVKNQGPSFTIKR